MSKARDIADLNVTILDSVESGATADQTNAEIRAAVEAATDSNVFTDADHTKLNSTVATVAGAETLTNKTLTAPDINTPDIDGGTIDGAVIGSATAAAISGTTITASGEITANSASTITVTEGNHVNGLKLINSQAGGYGSALTFQSERSDNNAVVSAAQIRTQGQDSWNSEASADSNLFFATSANGSLTDKVTIKHDGNVGIGVSPATKFDVMATGANQWYIRNTDSSAQNNSITSLRTGGYSNIAVDGASVQLKIAGSPKMTIDSGGVSHFSGNVGVGVVPQTNWAGSVHDGDVIQVGTAGAVYGRGGGNLDMHVSSNLSRDSSGNFKTIATGASQFLQLSGGSYHFNSAASVSAGATATQTTKATLDGSGNLSLTGNIEVAAGKGIDFSANSHAGGMTSETLNDYEIGSWTPTIVSYSGTNPTVTGTMSGSYTKIGNRVILSFGGSAVNVSGITGNILKFMGLPFAISDSHSVGSWTTHYVNLARPDFGGLTNLANGIGVLTSMNGGGQSWSWENVNIIGTNVSFRASFSYTTNS
jgi:hypothetical protein